MRVYSFKTFAGLTIVSIVVGLAIVEFAYLGLDALYPYAWTSSGEPGGTGFFKPSAFGTLSLSALAVSDSDVELTLSLVNRGPDSHYDLKMWITNNGAVGLPEGFELVSGNLSWYGSGETIEVRIKASIRAVKDGEGKVDGWASMYAPGSSESIGSGAVLITVSNGKVTDIRRVKQEFSEPVSGGQMAANALNISADLEINHDFILTNNNVTRFHDMSVLVHGDVKLLENATLMLDNAGLYVLARDIVVGGTSTFIALNSVVDPNTIIAEDQSSLVVSNTRLICQLVLNGSAQLNLSNSSAGPSNLYDYSKATIFNSTIGLDASGSSIVRIHNCKSTERLSATDASNVEIFSSTIGGIYLQGNASLSMFSSKAAYLDWSYYRGTPLWNGSVYSHWRTTVKVVDNTGSPVSSAEVKIKRVQGDAVEQIFNGTTDSEGVVETYLLEKMVRAGRILMGGNETIARQEEILNSYDIEAMYDENSASTSILANDDTFIQLEVLRYR